MSNIETEPLAIEAAPEPQTSRNSVKRTLPQLLKLQAKARDTIANETIKRAAMTADGKKFNPAKLRAAENELEDLVLAEAELTRRERAKSDDIDRKRIREEEKQVHQLAEKWVNYVD